MMLESLFQQFQNKKVLVVGDVMIDAYLSGRVGRISPEAPVPIVEIRNRVYRVGGAANVALNVKSLGAEAILCSVIGQDEKADIFMHLLAENGLSPEGICCSGNRKTTIKYRIIGNKAQMLRIDEEQTESIAEEEQTLLWKRMEHLLETKNIDAIVFEDYDKGVLSKELIAKTVDYAKRQGILTTVDPKKRNFHHYAGVDLFKPNLKELAEGLKVDKENLSLEEIRTLMADFAKENDMRLMLTTLSERGVALYDRQRDTFFSEPACPRQISDVSGAGDTVIAMASLCLTAGLSPDEAASMANLAGGIVCEYAGVVPVTPEMIRQKNRNTLV